MPRPLPRSALLLPVVALVALCVSAVDAAPLQGQTPEVSSTDTLVLARGRVTDQRTGAGVANAVVRLAGTAWWALTDVQGGFSIGHVPGGVYAVEVRHPDYVSRAPRVTVGAALLDLKLIRGPSALGMAQGTSSVAVQVVDENGRPWPGASVVSARGARGARTDAAGVAFLSSLPNGEDTVFVAAQGMDPAAEVVRLGDAPGSARVVLRSRAVRLARIAATATPAARGPGLAGFEHRRQTGRGHFLDRAAIEAKHPTRFTDVLRGVPGVRLQMGPNGTMVPVFDGAAPSSLAGIPRPGSGVVVNGYQPPMAGPAPGMENDNVPESMGSNTSCQVQYYVDGQLQAVASSAERTPNRETVVIDQFVDVRQVQAVEVYRSGATAPAEYKRYGADCGIIVIWTRA